MTITDPTSSDPNGVDFQYYTTEFYVHSTTNQNPITLVSTSGWTYDLISILNYTSDSETTNKIAFTIPSTIPVAYIGIMGPAGNGGSDGGSDNDDGGGGGGGGGGWYTGVLPNNTGYNFNLYLCAQTPPNVTSPVNLVTFSGNSTGYNCGAAGWGTNGKDAESNSTGHAGDGGTGATNSQLYIDNGTGGTSVSIQYVSTWLFNGGGGGGGGSANNSGTGVGTGAGSGGSGGTSQSFQSTISGVDGGNGKDGSDSGGNGGHAGSTTYSCYDSTSITITQASGTPGYGGSGKTQSSGNDDSGYMGPIPYAMIYYQTP
jgi:hypothetical protein